MHKQLRSGFGDPRQKATDLPTFHVARIPDVATARRAFANGLLDKTGMQSAEVAPEAGPPVEVMTPDRTFAPNIMVMNQAPHMRGQQDKDVTFTVARQLLNVGREGNHLKATIGTDRSSHTSTLCTIRW